MKVSQKGIDLIKRFESLHDGDLHTIGLQPKMCPALLWTEGYGNLVLDDKGARIKGEENKAKAYHFSKVKNEADALKYLLIDLAEREEMINSLQLPLNQNQFDALVSFCYNIGFDNLRGSTLLRKIRVNPADEAIRVEFGKWKNANGKPLAGLIKRRAAEADLYFLKP